MAKRLPDSVVLEVYEMYKDGASFASIINALGVSESSVYFITSGRRYQHLNLERILKERTLPSESDLRPKNRILRSTELDLISGCWNWTGTKTNNYGYMRVRGVSKRSHRVSYEDFVGSIPDGMLVCHKCDNPSCCNPDHLFLETQDENMADRGRKRRQAIGSSIGSTNLTEKDVADIWMMLVSGMSNRSISKVSMASESVVSKIKRRRYWTHVTDSLPSLSSSKIRDSLECG